LGSAVTQRATCRCWRRRAVDAAGVDAQGRLRASGRGGPEQVGAATRGASQFFSRSCRSLGPWRKRSSCSEARRVIEAERDVPPCFDRCAVGDGEHCRAQAAWSRAEARRQDFHRRRPLPGENRRSVARLARALRLLEDSLQPLLKLVAARALGGHIQGASYRNRRRRCHDRHLRHPRTSGCVGRKRGIISNALGRSRAASHLPLATCRCSRPRAGAASSFSSRGPAEFGAATVLRPKSRDAFGFHARSTRPV